MRSLPRHRLRGQVALYLPEGAVHRGAESLLLSNLFKLGSETFDSFDLSYYDDKPDSSSGVSPRYKMTFIYDTCRDYASVFPEMVDKPLPFRRDRTWGKRFSPPVSPALWPIRAIPSCTTPPRSIFSRFEQEKFDKSDDPSATRAEIRRFLECDLLILDDLGTEMTTSFTVSALYVLVNTRLLSGKKNHHQHEPARRGAVRALFASDSLPHRGGISPSELRRARHQAPQEGPVKAAETFLGRRFRFIFSY